MKYIKRIAIIIHKINKINYQLYQEDLNKIILLMICFKVNNNNRNNLLMIINVLLNKNLINYQIMKTINLLYKQDYNNNYSKLIIKTLIISVNYKNLLQI